MKTAHPRNVVLLIPYPHITQTYFGQSGWNCSTQGHNLNQATRHRLAACTWLVGELKRVHILGVY